MNLPHQLPEQSTFLEAFVFSAKAAVSAVLAIVVFDLFGLPGPVWAAISAVIVTQPSLHPSVRASLLRVAANVIGALTGAAICSLLGPTLFALAVGVILTGLICHFLRLDETVRPAYAAAVIVILASGTSAWRGSLDRVLAVTCGCVVALVVGFLADGLTSRFTPAKAVAKQAADEPGHQG